MRDANPPVGGDSAATPGPAPRKLFAKAEGYLALLLALAFVLSPMCIRRVTGDFVVEGAVLLAIWACAWLFAIGGSRHGVGAGRLAAILALGLLVLHAVFVLTIAYL